MSAELLRELARVKAVFQLRAIEAVIRGPWVTLADGRPAYARDKLGDPQEGATCCQPSASAGQVAVFAEWHQAQKGRGR